MVKKIILSVILFFTAASFAQEISVKASTDTTDYKLGDYIRYKLLITNDPHVKHIPPAVKDSLSNIDVIDIKAPVTQEANGKKITTYEFILSRYDSATVTIPAIPVYYKVFSDTSVKLSPFKINDDTTFQVALSNPVTFTIHTVKVNVEEDIKDVKAPVTIPLDWKIITLYILIGLVIVAVVIYFYLRYRRKKLNAPVKEARIILPAHVIAMNKLKELDEKKLWQNGKVKEYHSEITGIIRTYFEERFRLPALEMTTSELLYQLRQRSGTANIITLTEEFLNNADLVKFAKFVPMHTVNEEMMRQATSIVEHTTPKVEPVQGGSNVQ